MSTEETGRRIDGIGRVLPACALFAATLLAFASASAQTGTGRIAPAIGTRASELPANQRPFLPSLGNVSEVTARFFGGDRAALDFTVDVANAGTGAGNFLVTGTVFGAEGLLTTKPQRIAAGGTQSVPVRFNTTFDCRGSDRFAVVISLVDHWDGLDRRGVPLNTRVVDTVIRWVDASREKQGRPVDAMHCQGEAPFASGVVASHNLDGPIMLPFDPSVDGFNFTNHFKIDFITEIDLITAGLCGGMAYAALDYYHAGIDIPRQDYQPADHTRLFKYIYDRQVNSIVSNYDQWFELRQNPGGIRNTTIFNWGLGERLADVREFIDQGEPAVLGLKGANGSDDHQVIAVGYFLGRYAGDSGPYAEDTKIFVYDPNFPNKIMTLIPNMSRQFYYYDELKDELPADDDRPDELKVGVYYQGYYVDRKYHQARPPSILTPDYPNDGLVHDLLVRIDTGGDDLREGAHADATIVTRDGREQLERDINGGLRWINNFQHYVRIELDEPVPYEELEELRLSFRSGGRGTSDNWNVDTIWVQARGQDRRVLYDVTAAPLVRFTGDRRSFTAYLETTDAADGYIRQVDLTLQTGGDNLRGDTDNVDAEILFADGTSQRAEVINNSIELRNNSALVYPVVLETPVAREDIVGVRLTKTPGGDNWNLDALKVDFRPINRVSYTRFLRRGTPLDRFGGSRVDHEYMFD